MASPGRVLLVEDEPALCRVYARALSAAGFDVAQAADGAEALERLLAGDFDVVVSDVCMPRMDGLELLRVVRQQRPDVPVVLITAQLDAGAYDRARDLGSVRYLLKPVRLAHLARAVEGAVALHGAWTRARERRRAAL